MYKVYSLGNVDETKYLKWFMELMHRISMLPNDLWLPNVMVWHRDSADDIYPLVLQYNMLIDQPVQI